MILGYFKWFVYNFALDHLLIRFLQWFTIGHLWLMSQTETLWSSWVLYPYMYGSLMKILWMIGMQKHHLFQLRITSRSWNAVNLFESYWALRSLMTAYNGVLLLVTSQQWGNSMFCLREKVYGIIVCVGANKGGSFVGREREIMNECNLWTH